MHRSSMRTSLATVVVALCLTFPAVAADATRGRVDTAEADWPAIAGNQDVQPRPAVDSAANVRFASCKDPCLGGSDCGDWEVLWENYCRSISGSYSSDCQPASGRYCARRIYTNVEDGNTGQSFRQCQTCLY
jgi:hypothetical protein